MKCTYLLTSYNSLIVNKSISGCIRMAYDSLLTTRLLQVVKRHFASSLSKRFIHRLGATSSMTDLLYCTLMKRTNLLELLTSCNKLAKFATCNKSVTFLNVRACRAVTGALIRGVYIHIFRFCPTSFF